MVDLYTFFSPHATGPFALAGSLSRTGIHLTSLTNLLVSLVIGNFRQPVAETVRLKTPFLSSRATCPDGASSRWVTWTPSLVPWLKKDSSLKKFCRESAY